MFGLRQNIRTLNQKELKHLHQGSLKILEDPGMKIMVPQFLTSLETEGAKVNHHNQTVSFPPELIERTLEIVRGKKEEVSGFPFSWHKNFTLSNRPREVYSSFGGACLYYYDYAKRAIRESTAMDMLRMVQLGEALPEVKSVGNPLVYLREPNGKRVHPKLVNLKGAALIAKNTSKPASAQVLSPEELELVVEIGIVLKGSWEKYKKEQFLMSVKEPTPPLRLTEPDGNVILAMARKGLTCHICPMPLMGFSSPITPASAMALGNAEILGIWTAIKSFAPDVPVEASVVSGVMDAKTGQVSFSAPEAILIDLGIAQLYEEHYHLDCSAGAPWIDAKYPGLQAGLERAFKVVTASLGGRINYPAGTLAGHKVFSPEQAVIDLDVAGALNRFLDGTEVNEETICLDLIRKVGIGGNFFAEEHTVSNFRKTLWFPHLFDRTAPSLGKIDAKEDIIARANRRWNKILEEAEPYHLEPEKVKEIDKIVKRGEKILLKS